jgi:hypothetical protein
MDTSDDWASDAPVDKDTLETVSAVVFKEHLDSLLMALDHVLDDDKQARRSQLKASLWAKGKGKTSAAPGNYAQAAASSQPPLSRDTTPLSYVATPFSPGASLALSTPTLSSRRASSGPQDRFLKAMHDHVTAFPNYSPPLPLFFRFAEEVLGFVWTVLRNPQLKDAIPPTQGMCGLSSFEVALAQIIAQTGPPPPEAALPPPPAPLAMRRRPADVETMVMPQKSKRVKFQLAPPINPAASKKRVPAPAVAAPPRHDNTKAKDTALKPVTSTANPPSSLSKRRRRWHKGKHTAHSPLRRGIRLTPPTGSSILAKSITPELIWEINAHLGKDVDPTSSSSLLLISAPASSLPRLPFRPLPTSHVFSNMCAAFSLYWAWFPSRPIPPHPLPISR